MKTEPKPCDDEVDITNVEFVINDVGKFEIGIILVLLLYMEFIFARIYSSAF